jgi:hypothetical protein
METIYFNNDKAAYETFLEERKQFVQYLLLSAIDQNTNK